jgi:hypothetical protein
MYQPTNCFVKKFRGLLATTGNSARCELDAKVLDDRGERRTAADARGRRWRQVSMGMSGDCQPPSESGRGHTDGPGRRFNDESDAADIAEAHGNERPTGRFWMLAS